MTESDELTALRQVAQRLTVERDALAKERDLLLAEVARLAEAAPKGGASAAQVEARVQEVRRILRGGEQYVCLCSRPGEPITFGYRTGSHVSIWHGHAERHWFDGEPDANMLYGFEACWREFPKGHCRMPKGHDGECAPS